MKAVVALIAVGLVGVASPATLPKKAYSLPNYFKTCKRNEENFDACILSSLQKLLPHLVKGIPQLDLPSIDPYRAEEAIIEYANGHLQGKMSVRDSVTYGLSGMQFVAVRTDFSNKNDLKIQIDVSIPNVKIQGKYKAHGTFLGSDIGSRGNFELSMVNVTTTWDIHGALETLDGEQYMKVKHFGMNPDVGSMKIYASDLFSGNPELSKNVLVLFNQYWKPIYEELLPYVRESWDKVLRGIANRIFLRVPFAEIFPVSS